MSFKSAFKKTFHPNRVKREREAIAAQQRSQVKRQALRQRLQAKQQAKEATRLLEQQVTEASQQVEDQYREQFDKITAAYNKYLQYYKKTNDSLTKRYNADKSTILAAYNKALVQIINNKQQQQLNATKEQQLQQLTAYFYNARNELTAKKEQYCIQYQNSCIELVASKQQQLDNITNLNITEIQRIDKLLSDTQQEIHNKSCALLTAIQQQCVADIKQLKKERWLNIANGVVSIAGAAGSYFSFGLSQIIGAELAHMVTGSLALSSLNSAINLLEGKNQAGITLKVDFKINSGENNYYQNAKYENPALELEGIQDQYTVAREDIVTNQQQIEHDLPYYVDKSVNPALAHA